MYLMQYCKTWNIILILIVSRSKLQLYLDDELQCGIYPVINFCNAVFAPKLEIINNNQK